MEKIRIDLETYSSVDLGKCGVYKYSEAEDFEILLFGYSVDGGDLQVVDLAQGEVIPEEILLALMDVGVEKWAFNAQFERICLSVFLQRTGYLEDGYLRPEGWHCSLVWSAYLGLPLSLASVGAALGLEEQKMKEGKDLIRYFCVPCKPTKSNGGRCRNLPEHAMEKWELFKKYNIRDVEVEMEIGEKLARFPVPDFVWEEYWIDQEINDRGIRIDRQMVENAIRLDAWSQEKLKEAMQELTMLENPNSVAQMKQWLADQGMETDSLGKKVVAEMIRTAPEPLRTVLMLRQQSAKSAVKKYVTMENAACQDDRCHGMFMFYGANRSGRWSGRIVQLQNLYRNSLSDLDEARALVRDGNAGALEVLYDSVPEVLAELVRTAFVPGPGMKFVVADFSAIEARVLSYMAGEEWRMEVFHNGGDIYCATASRMFGVPVEKHGVNGDLRQKGKQAELACGYGGGAGAMKAMGAVEMGIPEEELDGIVQAWRNASPKIVKMWWDVDRAVKKVIKEKTTAVTHGLRFLYQSGMLFIELPSGRRLAYVKPRIGENRFGGESVTYMGIGGTKKWERIESYGPKFVENIIQAISRDVLMNSMRTLREYRIVAHVHDELIIECPVETELEKICEMMGREPEWLPGIELRADGYECWYYKKD